MVDIVFFLVTLVTSVTCSDLDLDNSRQEPEAITATRSKVMGIIQGGPEKNRTNFNAL